MHLAPLQGNTIEKILRDQSGRLARVTFYVYEQGGRMKARVVNVAYLEETISDSKPLALSGSIHAKPVITEISFEHEIVSPYFDSAILYTLGSKPRAPSF